MRVPTPERMHQTNLLRASMQHVHSMLALEKQLMCRAFGTVMEVKSFVSESSSSACLWAESYKIYLAPVHGKIGMHA